MFVQVQDGVFQMTHGPREEDVYESPILSHRDGDLNNAGVAAVYAPIRPSLVGRAKPFHLEVNAAVSLGSEFHLNADWVSVAKP